MASSKTKVLIVSSRFPWPPIRGDRLRALVWLEALREAADVTIVAPRGDVPEGFATVGAAAVEVTASSAIRCVLGVLFRGWPLQLLYAPLDWRAALARLDQEKEFDVALVLLSRTDPVVRPHIRSRVRILDAVDSLARSMDERRASASWLLKPLWSLERRRMRRLEARVAEHYDHVVVVSPEEVDDFGPGTHAISNGVEVLPLDGSPREIDFGFWGRIAYFANLDAVELLVRSIWPAIRHVHPNATLALAGADATHAVRRLDGRDGIKVVSPVEDRSLHLRRVRIMLFPIRYGTGQLNKILEAVEAGCAIVATSTAMRGLDDLRPAVCIEDDPARFAKRAAHLLDHETEQRERGESARMVVRERYSRAATTTAMRRLVIEGAG